MFTLFSKPKKMVTFPDSTVVVFGNDKEVTLHAEGQLTSYSIKNSDIGVNDHGVKIIEVSGLETDKREDRSWSFATFDKSGFCSKHFYKKRTETYYVTFGVAIVVTDGTEHVIKEGESIELMPNQQRQVFNASDECGLEVLVKCTPSWNRQDVDLVETGISSGPAPK